MNQVTSPAAASATPEERRKALVQKLHNKLRQKSSSRDTFDHQRDYLKNMKMPEKLIEPLLQYMRNFKSYPFPEEVMKNMHMLPIDAIDQLLKQMKMKK